MIVSMEWRILKEYRERHTQKFWLILAGLFVFVGTLTLVVFGNEIASYLHEEVFKLLAQLVILAGIGGLGHLILTEINTSRERRDAKRTLLQTALNDIVGVYNEVKSVRGLLRAEAVRPNVMNQNAYVLKKPYVAYLRRLNDAQLKLETQLRLIKGNKDEYQEPENLKKLLGDAEGYLGQLISEWERKLGSLSERPKKNKLADFEFLPCFLAKAKQCFGPAFAEPLGEVFGVIGRGIAQVSDGPRKKNKKKAEK